MKRAVKGMYIGNAEGVPHHCKTCGLKWDEGMYWERDTNYWGYVLEDGGICPKCGESDDYKVGPEN